LETVDIQGSNIANKLDIEHN